MTHLAQTTYDLDDSEIISEVMEGAPANWSTILTTQSYETTMDFQSAIKYHEDTLLELDKMSFTGNRSNELVDSWYSRSDLPAPLFPRDDSNVSSRATPASKDARPCQHCGSGQHWDRECKYANKKVAHVCLCETSIKNLQAEDEYNELYSSICEEDF
ncbi:hypothetical protein K435DRAFT_821263 [Dendrothele bispora CBS 962.96]|uniref:Uncharacterized protein n=1 Tax=Dendrothele bispora (strain CBS 962.96) TaxID=1314807 RepID=A0A4V4HE78_DENBC|nr:hypothetical protein K435DRAFT_821263 [Dendrothele bispora CBS 962.96]